MLKYVGIFFAPQRNIFSGGRRGNVEVPSTAEQLTDAGALSQERQIYPPSLSHQHMPVKHQPWFFPIFKKHADFLAYPLFSYF